MVKVLGGQNIIFVQIFGGQSIPFDPSMKYRFQNFEGSNDPPDPPITTALFVILKNSARWLLIPLSYGKEISAVYFNLFWI